MDKDGSEIYRTKAGFRYPLSRDRQGNYKVKSGDYLGKIASRYGVTINQIKNWNNLRSNNIRVGQTLYIYRNGGPAVSSSSSTSSSSTAARRSENFGSSASSVCPAM